MSSAPQADVLPKLAKYEIVEELGHGGMATVYRARDMRLEREVAVKIIHRHLRESSEVAARFEAEARAVAKLRHPNIIEVYDVSEPGEPEKYIVVELSRGTTLRHVLAGLHAIPPKWQRRWGSCWPRPWPMRMAQGSSIATSSLKT